METLKRFSLFLLVCAFATALHAQTMLTTTTLTSAVGNTVSSALTTGNLGMVVVASATGISAPTANSGNVAGLATSGGSTYLYVDRELMQVESVSGTTITVIRGVGSTAAASHASGALVFVVPAAAAANWGVPFGTTDWGPQGSCTRANELYLPRIAFTSGNISDCQGGQWMQGDSAQTTRPVWYRAYSPSPGAQASSAVFGTNSTLVQYSTYCTEIDVGSSKLLTGLAPHVGTTGGTDKWVVGLYDNGGNLLVGSAAAGVTVGSAYAWQATAFTAPYYAVGPAQYYGCFTTNGTTATADLVTTSKGDYVLTQSKTGTGFALPASITVPTGFTNVSGAYLYAY
jgi:hypothetical protein